MSDSSLRQSIVADIDRVLAEHMAHATGHGPTVEMQRSDLDLILDQLHDLRNSYAHGDQRSEEVTAVCGTIYLEKRRVGGPMSAVIRRQVRQLDIA